MQLDSFSKGTAISVDAPPLFRIAGSPQARHVAMNKDRFTWGSHATGWGSPYNMPQTYTHGPQTQAART